MLFRSLTNTITSHGIREARASGVAWVTAGANPSKANGVKGCEVNKISLSAEKQTQSGYLVLYQYDGEKKTPFFEENGCFPASCCGFKGGSVAVVPPLGRERIGRGTAGRTRCWRHLGMPRMQSFPRKPFDFAHGPELVQGPESSSRLPVSRDLAVDSRFPGNESNPTIANNASTPYPYNGREIESGGKGQRTAPCLALPIPRFWRSLLL